MKMISIPFAVSKNGKVSEEEYLPGLLLEVNKSRKGGGMLKKSGEVMDGIAELAIPLLVSFYERRGRGILFLHQMLADEKTLQFPEVVAHDPDLLEEKFSQVEADYDEYIREFSALISSVTEIKKDALEFNSLPSKNVLDDLKGFLSFAYEREDAGAFVFDTWGFEGDLEVQEIHKILDCEEDKLSGLPSILDSVSGILTRKTDALKKNLDAECEQAIAERNKKRRGTIDAFKIKALEIKQLKRGNDGDEEKLLSVRVGRKETIEFKHNQEKDALSRTKTAEEREQMTNAITEHKKQLAGIDGEIREIKSKAENRRKELHDQLLALDAKLENFDNETKSIDYEYREKTQKLDRLSERLEDAKEAYVINMKNELTDRINDLGINLPLPDVAEDIHGSFFVYIPVYIAAFKDDKAGTQRFVVFPPNYIDDETKSISSALLTKFKKIERREGLDLLLKGGVTKTLVNDNELELKVLEHTFNNSIASSSSDTHDVIIKGAEKLKNKGRISEKEYRIIEGMMRGGKKR